MGYVFSIRQGSSCSLALVSQFLTNFAAYVLGSMFGGDVADKMRNPNTVLLLAVVVTSTCVPYFSYQ